MDRINTCKPAGTSNFMETAKPEKKSRPLVQSRFNRTGSNSGPEKSPEDTPVTSRKATSGPAYESGAMVSHRVSGSDKNPLTDIPAKKNAALGSRLFFSNLARNTIKGLLTLVWPSKLNGIKEGREKLKVIKTEIRRHKKQLADVQRDIKREENRHKKEKTAETIEDLNSYKQRLSDELSSMNETKKKLTGEILDAENSVEELQNGIADLATNLRNLYRRPLDTPLKICLQHLPVSTANGNFLLQNVQLVPENIRINSNEGEDTITIVASVPGASLSMPVNGAESINCEVKLKALEITLAGSAAASLIRYVKAQGPYDVVKQLKNLLSDLTRMIQNKENPFARHEPEKEIDAAERTGKNKQAEDTMPSDLSIHADEVDVQLAGLNSAQAASLERVWRQPGGMQGILTGLLELPVNTTVNRMKVQTQNPTITTADDQIQMALSIEKGQVIIKPDKGVRQNGEISSSISASAKTLSLDMKHPSKSLSALKKELNVFIPGVTGGERVASSSGAAELIGSASITSTNVKAEAVVSLEAGKPDSKEATMQELRPEEWLKKLNSTARVTASDVTFRGEGSVNITGNLKQLEVNHHYAAGNRKTDITFGDNEDKDSRTSLSCQGNQVQDSRAPLFFKGAVNLEMKGRGAVSLEKNITAEDKTETILAVEKLPEIKVETKETVELSTERHSLSLPAGMAISVNDLAFKQTSTGENTGERVTEISHGKIEYTGNGEVGYRGKNSHGSVVDKDFPVAGTWKSKPARFIHKEQRVSGQLFRQVKTNEGGIELEGLELPGGHLKKIDIAVDRELNGKASIEGLSLDFNTLLRSKSLPPEVIKKIPWYVKFFLKNKKLNVNAKFSVNSGNISINDRSGIKAYFKAEKGSGMMNKLTTLIANNVLQLGSFVEKYGLLNLHSDGRHLMVSSSLRKGHRYALHSEKADKFAQATGMDASGNINITNALHAYTGVMLLPESETSKLDSFGAQALGGDEQSIIELIDQAEALLSNPATHPLGLYALQQVPWPAILQRAIPESGELYQKLSALAELAMKQDETCISGVMLAQKLNMRLGGDKAQQLFNRCIKSKQDLLPLGDLFSTASGAATKKLAFKCYQIAVRRNPDNGKAHYKYAQMLIPADGVLLPELKQEIIGHLEKAACFGVQPAYNQLSDIAKTSEYAVLAMARVHMFNDVHMLTPIVIKDSAAPSWQDSFNEMYSNLSVLSQSKNSDIAEQARNLLTSRCIESIKIIHPWPESHYEAWNNLMEKARDKASGKKEGQSPLTDNQCVDIAKTCLYALNGQSQDLVLAKTMLDTLKMKTTEAQLLLETIDAVNGRSQL